MASVNYKNLLKLYEHKSPAEATHLLREGFQANEFKPEDFSLAKLFIECFGWSNFVDCRSNQKLAQEVFAEQLLMEAPGAVSTAAFQNITKQITYSAIMDAYLSEEFVFTRVIPEVQTEFNGERIPGITQIGDEAQIVDEGQPFPVVGVSETYIDTPVTRKRGLIVPVTREAIFFDRTGILLDRCNKVGWWLGQNKEKRAIDCIIDENTTDHRYRYRDTTIQTYGDNSGTHSWDNLVASNALVDWTDVDNAEQALNNILDPDTGEPVMLDATHLIVTKQLEQTAMRILSATQIVVVTPGYATSANPTETTRTNPYNGKYELLTSRLLATRLATDTTWFLGNPRVAFRYMVNWPMQVIQAPSNSHDEFHRDIVAQFRADERGAFSTWEPRYMITNTA